MEKYNFKGVLNYDINGNIVSAKGIQTSYGNTFEGNFINVNNRLILTKGTFRNHTDKSIHTGEFILVNEKCVITNGSIHFKSGQTQRGTFGYNTELTHIFLIEGSTIFPSGMIHTGHFTFHKNKNVLIKGTKQMTNGKIYEGDFIYDKNVSKLVKGKIIFTNNKIFEGDFADDGVTCRLITGKVTYPKDHRLKIITLEGKFEYINGKSILTQGKIRYTDDTIDFTNDAITIVKGIIEEGEFKYINKKYVLIPPLTPKGPLDQTAITIDYLNDTNIIQI